MDSFRIFKILSGWIILLFLIHPQTALPVSEEGSGRLSVLSEIPGLTVWVDSMAVGQTPIDSLPLPSGPHTLRVKHPDPQSWMARDWEKIIQIRSGEMITEAVRFPKAVWISSDPAHVQLFIHDQPDGLTPRYVLCPDTGLTLRFDNPGFQSRQLFLNPDGPVLHVTLTPVPDFAYQAKDESVFQSGKIWAAGLISLSTGIAGYVFKHLAEQSYDRYLEAGHPAEMNKYYDRAVLYDQISGGCYIACEVHFGLALYFSIRGAR
jgi:hypothetical protein